MILDLFGRRRAERFAELLDETTGGRGHHSRGQDDEQLAELVAIGHRLAAADVRAPVEPEFRVGLRAMLIATAERDGIGATASAVETEPGAHVGVRESRRLLRLAGSGRRIRARGAIVIGVAVGAMAVSGISAASENASPGDPLYGVKRSTERAQLAMARSDSNRGELNLEFARTRLAEATAMPGRDRAFPGVLDDMDADTVKGVRLLTGSAVSHSEATRLTTVDTFVTRQRNTIEPMLDRLSPANKERALESVGLLDRVRGRTASLREGLACTTPVQEKADVLGPQLKDCLAGAVDTAPGQRQGTAGKTATKPAGSAGTGKTKPERNDPAVTPGTTGRAVPSSGDQTVPGTDPTSGNPTPDPTSSPDEDTGILDGIIHGILGH